MSREKYWLHGISSPSCGKVLRGFTSQAYKLGMRQLPVMERVRVNCIRLMRQPSPPHRTRIKQAVLAKALGVSVGQISNFLRGEDGIALKHLDPLADVLGVPTSELVRTTEYPMFELTEPEARMVTYLRQWTPAVRQSLLNVLDFLHARLPADRQTVEMFDYWGRLGNHERNLIFAQAVRLTDEGLAPEVKARLGIQETSADRGHRKGTIRPRP